MREQEIIAHLLSRQEQGISEVLEQYGALIRYVAAPILPEETTREECVQDVLLRIWERIDQYDADKGSWTAWITAITRNAAIDIARKKRRDAASEELRDDMAANDLNPEEQLLAEERRTALVRALGMLSSRDRILFYRKYYYLQPVRQIAAELGSTERAVEGRLYRIRRKLQRLMGGEEV